MKLVEGEGLDLKIAAATTLPARLRLIEHVIAVADAIAYAHEQNIIHRDLKPANVLVGRFGETVVIDWGLAKDLSGEIQADIEAQANPAAVPGGVSDMTEAGTIMGTLRYMAPEQARGDNVDERSDVYALGAILYHVLSGKPPFGGDSAALALRVDRGALAELRRVEPAVPRELAAIAHRAMALDPEDRYASAVAFAEDLRRYQAGRLVSAHHYSLAEVAGLWLRRHRAVAGVAALGVAALTFTGAAAFERITRERDEAEAQRHLAELARTTAEEARVEALRRADETLLAEAGAALERDPLAALRLLGELHGHDPSILHHARLLGLALTARDLPARVLRGHSNKIVATALLPAGLLALDAHGSVRRWDPATGASEELLRLPAPADGVPFTTLVHATQSPTWAVITDRALVFRNDAKQPLEISLTPLGKGAHLYDWSLSPDGDTLLAFNPGRLEVDFDGSAAGTELAFFCDLRRPSPTLEPFGAWTDSRAQVSADGHLLAHHDGEHLVLSDRRDASERRIAGAGLQRGVFSDSGRFLVAPHTLDPQRKADLSLRIIDATSGRVRAYPGQWAVPVPGDRALVANEADPQPATLSLLDLASGTTLWARSFPQVFRDGDWTWKPDNRPPPGLRLGPDGHAFALRSGDTWNWIDLETGGQRVHLEHSEPPLLLRDGRRATVHGDDLWVWDAAAELPELDGNVRMLSPRADHALAIRDPGALPPTVHHVGLGSGQRTQVDCPVPAGFAQAFDTWALDDHGRVLWGSATWHNHGRTDLPHLAAICLWTPEAGARSIDVPRPDLSRVALAGDGKGFAATALTGEIMVWTDADAAPRIKSLHADTGAPAQFNGFYPNPIDDSYAVATPNGVFLIRPDVAEPVPVLAPDTDAVRPIVDAFTWSPDGAHLAVRYPELGVVAVHDQSGVRRESHDIAGAPGDHRAEHALADRRGPAQLSAHPDLAILAFSLDGQQLIAAANRKQLAWIDRRSTRVHRLDLPVEASAAIFVRDGLILASAIDGTLQLIDPVTANAVSLAPSPGMQPVAPDPQLRSTATGSVRYLDCTPHRGCGEALRELSLVAPRSSEAILPWLQELGARTGAGPSRG
jgi:hypothetical protein